MVAKCLKSVQIRGLGAQGAGGTKTQRGPSYDGVKKTKLMQYDKCKAQSSTLNNFTGLVLIHFHRILRISVGIGRENFPTFHSTPT